MVVLFHRHCKQMSLKRRKISLLSVFFLHQKILKSLLSHLKMINMGLATRDWILQQHFLEEKTYLVSILGREKMEGGASLGRYCKQCTVEIIPIIMVGLVVRALAFHQCDPGSISALGVIRGLSLLVLYSAMRGFPFSPKTNIWFDLIWFVERRL